MLLLVVNTVVVVTLRYGFNISITALQESIIYWHAIAIALGVSYTLLNDGHVRVDVVYRRLSVKTQATINIFGNILFLFPVSIFIIWVSYDYVYSSWVLLERSTENSGLPWVYVLKTFIPILGITLLLSGIYDSYRQLLIIKKTQQK